MDRTNDVLVEYTLAGLGTEVYSSHVAHAICLAGHCLFTFNGNDFELRPGDLMIVRKGTLVENIRPSDDFKVKVLYATSQFINLSAPQSNYGTKGALA